MTTPEDILRLSEQREYIDVIESVRVLLGFPDGRRVLKYLFKIGGVGEVPDEGLLPDFLRSEIGRLKLGREIYKLVSTGDHQQAALLLAEVEKEREDARP